MNIYEQIALEQAILRADKPIIGEGLGDVAVLIDQNPFSQRIWLLLTSPDIATSPVLNAKGEILPPNCLGTAFFVAKVGSFDRPYHAYDDELDPHLERKVEGAEIPNGAFCFSGRYDSDDGYIHWHAGINLGTVCGWRITFAQHGKGGIFAIELLKKYYANPEFYIPRTLPRGG